MNRATRVQVSKIIFYWAVLTVGFSVAWTVLLNTLRLVGLGAALSLALPAILGGVAAVGLYWLRDHQVLEYDEKGYRIAKGRGPIENHSWSEFAECSIIRDSYGRQKVRAYEERDGQHVDVDTLACGASPYAFRDFMITRLGSVSPGGEDVSDIGVFDGLEKEIHRGRASWIADLSETFRKYQLSGERFHLIARGGTRPKGFLLSRFLATTVLPNYQVCLYASDMKSSGSEAKTQIMRLIRIIETQRDQKDIKWSWLLLLSGHEPPALVSKFIETFGNKEIGIGHIDVTTGKITTSPNQLGRSLSNQMRLGKLIRDLRKRGQIPT